MLELGRAEAAAQQTQRRTEHASSAKSAHGNIESFQLPCQDRRLDPDSRHVAFRAQHAAILSLFSPPSPQTVAAQQAAEPVHNPAELERPFLDRVRAERDEREKRESRFIVKR